MRSTNNLEYACLKSRLKPLIYADEHVLENGEYHIRSVYFDDWSDSAYNKKRPEISSVQSIESGYIIRKLT